MKLFCWFWIRFILYSVGYSRLNNIIIFNIYGGLRDFMRGINTESGIQLFYDRIYHIMVVVSFFFIIGFKNTDKSFPFQIIL